MRDQLSLKVSVGYALPCMTSQSQGPHDLAFESRCRGDWDTIADSG